MKKTKLRSTRSVLIAAYFILLVVIYRAPTLSDLTIETISANLFSVSTLLPVLLVGAAYVILSQLYLVHLWSIMLIILAIFGTGIEKPLRFVLYPGISTIAGPVSTFLAVIVFWIFELVAAKYFGMDWFSEINDASFIGKEEMIALNLSSNAKREKTIFVEPGAGNTETSQKMDLLNL